MAVYSNRLEDLTYCNRNTMAAVLRMACRGSKGKTRVYQLGDLKARDNVGMHQHDSYGVVSSDKMYFKGRTYKSIESLNT